MNILLTGANGFLGKIIIETLEKEYQILTLSRNSGTYRVSLDKDVPTFRETCDLVVHAAGKAHSVPKTEIESKHFYDVNVTGTINLLIGLEKIGLPKQFVFISSVSVYGQESGKDINEENLLEAKDPYGLSKIDAELIVMEWCIKHRVVCTILRLPLLVGENPPGNLGAMLKAIKKGYYFNIGGGNTQKSMVLGIDVARFIPIVALVGGVYNLTDGVHPTFNQLSSTIANKKQPNLPLILAKGIGYIGDIFGDKVPISSSKIKKMNSLLTFEDSKAKKLGWEPESVLEYLRHNKL